MSLTKYLKFVALCLAFVDLAFGQTCPTNQWKNCEITSGKVEQYNTFHCVGAIGMPDIKFCGDNCNTKITQNCPTDNKSTPVTNCEAYYKLIKVTPPSRQEVYCQDCLQNGYYLDAKKKKVYFWPFPRPIVKWDCLEKPSTNNKPMQFY